MGWQLCVRVFCSNTLRQMYLNSLHFLFLAFALLSQHMCVDNLQCFICRKSLRFTLVRSEVDDCCSIRKYQCVYAYTHVQCCE